MLRQKARSTVFSLIGGLAMLASSIMGFPSPTPAYADQDLHAPFKIAGVEVTFDPAQPVVVKLSKLDADADGFVRTNLGEVFFAYEDTSNNLPVVVHPYVPITSDFTVTSEMIPLEYRPGNLGAKLMLKVRANLPNGTVRQGRFDMKYLKDGQWVWIAYGITYRFELTDKPVGCPKNPVQASIALGGNNWQKLEGEFDVTRVLTYDGPAVPMHTPDWQGAFGHVAMVDANGQNPEFIFSREGTRTFSGEHIVFVCDYDDGMWR